MPATVYDAVIGSTTLKQVMRSSYAPGGNVIVGRASGAVDPAALYGGVAEPKATFESADVAGVVTGISVSTGLYVSAGTISIPYNERAGGGSFQGETSHNVLSGTTGLAIPTRFSAGQDDEAATAEIEMWFQSSDGVTNPVSITGSQTLSAQAFNAMYALGPVAIDGSALPGVQRVEVVPGITVLVRRAGGGLWPISLYIQARNPTITITFDDFDALAAFETAYDAISSAAVYFRKRAEGSSFVADATEEHIKFSFADGIFVPQDVSGQGQETGQASIMLTGEALTATATSAID